MYRHQRQSSPVLTVIVLGLIAGIAFMAYQRWSTPAAPPPPTFTPVPTLIPTLTSVPPVIPTLTPPLVLPRLSIPTAGILVSVVDIYLDGQSWDVRYLGDNSGHLQGTAWLGETGNIVLAGHVEKADGRAGIFANLDELRPGDPILLTQGLVQQRYAVIRVTTVDPTDLTVLYPTEYDQITLITCDDYDFLQNTYERRRVVIAERVT